MGEREMRAFGPVRVWMRGTSRADRLQIFFDVVFVYAFFNIARTAYTDITGMGLLKALLPLALLWRAWCSHILVANRVQPGEGGAPLVMFAAMAFALVFALTIPGAFGDRHGGVPEPLVIAGCYAAIRILHLALFWISAAGIPHLRRRLFRMARPMVIAVALLVGAAVIPARLPDSDGQTIRIALWVAAVGVEYGWLMAVRVWDWAVSSSEHWVERFELIVIIVLGEAIISVGVGVDVFSRPLTWLAVGGATLEIVVTAALWWGYFDHVAPKVSAAMSNAQGLVRVALARDGYIYLHLPMVAGIILFALGGEVLLSHLTASNVNPAIPPTGPGEIISYSGVILFFVSNVAFQLRALGTVAWPRLALVVVLAALLPVVGHLPAIVDLLILPLVCVVLVALESVFLGGQQLFLPHTDVRRQVEEAERVRPPQK